MIHAKQITLINIYIFDLQNLTGVRHEHALYNSHYIDIHYMYTISLYLHHITFTLHYN